MKSRKIKFVIAIFLIVCNIFFVSCQKTRQSNVVIQNDKNQYLNMLLENEPKILDPCKSTDEASLQILYEVNEALTRTEKDNKGKDVIKPAGAEKWNVSQDGLKWTFYLRDNYWSDGKKVTAKDYEYGIKRVLDPKIQCQYAFLLYSIKGATIYNNLEKNKVDNAKASNILGVKALDDNTLEIDLEKPCAYFLNLTSYEIMQPQRKDIIDKYGQQYGTEVNKMVFSGPFMIKQWNHNDKIELVKNSTYWDSKSVKLERVTMNIPKNDREYLEKLSSDLADIGNIKNVEWRSKLNNSNKHDILQVSEPAINFELFNEKDTLFKNDKIRKAFSLAIDREDICKTLWKEVYTPAYALIPPKMEIGEDDFREKANSEPIKKLKEDNPNPKALFIEGLRELGIEPDSSKITISYLQPDTDTKQKEIAEVFQKMYYKNLGVNIKINYVDYSNFVKKIEAGEYQMATMAWSGDYNDPMTQLDLWTTEANIIPTGWYNNRYDLLIRESSFLDMSKNQERFNKFKEAENILLAEDSVIAPTAYKNKQFYKCKFVKGITFPLFGPQIELKYVYTQGR